MRVLTPWPDLDAALRRATSATSDVRIDWLRAPPPGFATLERTVRLPRSADIATGGAALLGWDLHRRSGLRVVADGPARPGTTVALAARLGPVWAVAPCRVVDVDERLDRIGFTYVTLPGHPEHGIEEFAFERDASGQRFVVRAVTRPAYWASRLVPALARRVQADATERYVDAAIAVAQP